ncbi:CBO0543 family protein [Alkalihalobacterium bogoriense]|uniref:CBO0543 family protein n=1 Tax=Alkalihalobacterium bogoriense TaxID=246272 RepID=UPI000558052F|nr:CBO0543 family protein [Alkalihalobacterium bogoriense]
MFSSEKQLEALNKITSTTEKLTQTQIEYWTLYSHMNTWGFKVILLMFIIPLIALYFLIDRRKMLLLGFYGMNIHVWFSYINISGIRQGLFSYPFELIPFIPGNLALDATLIPVLFMLVYQWTINHRKNFYIYTIALSLVLSFIFKPLLVHFGFFVLHKGMNYFYLFVLYCVIFLFSKLITTVFLKMQNTRPTTI